MNSSKSAASNGLTASAMAIRMEQVVKTFTNSAGSFTALRGIDLEIGRGEFVGIVGRSGSGKSTLMNMVTGIDRPTAGRVWVGDVPVHSMSENQLAAWRGRQLGIVFQFFQLLPNLSALDNVRLPMDLLRMTPARQRLERAMSLLDLVGMADHARKAPSALSGGQQQRVAIARALANDPDVIIADEPTGNLDSKTADAVFQLFESLTQSGKTVVMVTHDSGLARRVSRTVLIEDGEVVNEYVARALPTLSPALMLEASRNAQPARFSPGENVLHPGTPTELLYIVTAGMAEVTLRRPNGTDVVVDRMGPGQFFGEISLFTSRRTAASVRSVREAALATLTIDRSLFQRLLRESPDFQKAMQGIVSERLLENRSVTEGRG